MNLIVHRIAALLEAPLGLLDGRRSTLAIALGLLPVMVVLLFPAGFGENESQYFMLALRRIAPDALPADSAAFDASHARLLSQLLIGVPVHLLGYEAAQILLRCLMMVMYAASLAYMLAALRLSMLQAILVVCAYALVGPDLMGAEWIFLGIESKTFAYACVFLGFGLAWRNRPLSAAAMLALATWFHFLVGGFWLLSLLLLMALRDQSLKPTWKPLALYAVLVLPVLGIVVNDQLIASAAPVPAHGLAADYLFAIVRVPHHATPFASTYQLGFWMQGIVATAGLLCAFLLLAPRVDGTLRPMVLWLALLLAYLLAAVAVSWFDRHTGTVGKFLPFRPSALILLFSVTALLLALRSLADGTPAADLCRGLIRAAFVVVVPVCLWASAKDSIKALVLDRGYADLPQALGFLDATARPGDIVLTDPDSDMTPLGADLPRLIRQPTLVSFKYAPQTPADIYRWWDLLEFRKRVYAGDCPKPGDPPVRFLLSVDPQPGASPACGQVVFRSRHFVVSELPPADR